MIHEKVSSFPCAGKRQKYELLCSTEKWIRLIDKLDVQALRSLGKSKLGIFEGGRSKDRLNVVG